LLTFLAKGLSGLNKTTPKKHPKCWGGGETKWGKQESPKKKMGKGKWGGGL